MKLQAVFKLKLHLKHLCESVHHQVEAVKWLDVHLFLPGGVWVHVHPRSLLQEDSEGRFL